MFDLKKMAVRWETNVKNGVLQTLYSSNDNIHTQLTPIDSGSIKSRQALEKRMKGKILPGEMIIIMINSILTEKQ